MSQALFTAEELDRFAKHSERVKRIAIAQSKPKSNQGNFHQRGYIYGDMRCCRCMKWLNENDPQEAAEIWYGKSMHRYHKRCPVYSPYTATLISCPKFHGTRKRIVDSAKRY